MANITSLGIGSGLQLESLVTAFIDAEAIPNEIRLQEKQDSLELELSGVGSFKSALSSFDTILDKLTASAAFNKQKVSVSSSAIEVTTNGFASNGSFSVDVQQLAKGSQLKSVAYGASTDLVGNGTLTLTAGTNTFDVAIDAADDLSAVRDKINQQAESFGVTANIINGDSGSYLIFNSTITGAANNLTVTTSDASLNNISVNNTQTAEQISTDAIITVDGETITQDNNIFKNIIEDVTITAKELSSGTPAVLTLEQDEENGADLLNEFVAGFNELVDQLTGLGASKQGRLAFDASVRQVKQQITNVAIQTVSGLSGPLSALTDLGLELDKDGKLQISTFTSENIATGADRMSNALQNNSESIGELFASSNGIATQMSSIIDSYIDFDGVLEQRETSLEERLSGVADEWEALESRLRSYEDTLRKQFTALDTTIAQYNATGDFLTSSLANLFPKNE